MKKVFLWIVIIGVLYFLIDQTILSIPCFFYKVTHFYCPGCGITRMILSLCHGDFLQAFRYNMLAFLLLPLFFIYFVLELFALKNNTMNIMNTKRFNKLWYLVIFFTILFGIARNIPCFSFLAPTVL